MGAEGPVVTGFLARSAESEVHLAAFSAAFNVSLIIEAPIIMLLAASTALATSQTAYWKLHRYMVGMSAGLTILHALVAFTPLFDLVAGRFLNLPTDAVEPTRTGLQIFLPWTAAIAYRRFQQGVLIRTEHTRLVLVGTALRLAVGFTTISLGFRAGWSGIVLATTTLSVGVLTEALYAWFVVRGPRSRDLPAEDEAGRRMSFGSFLSFYSPLAATPLLVLGVQPFGTATMSRMPRALESLAAYHGVHALVFLTRSSGFAFNEVVVTLLGARGAVASLVRFAKILGLVMLGALALFAFTPLGAVWFGRVQAFSPELIKLASGSLLFALVMPLNQILQSWFGGILVKSGRTRGITEAVGLYALAALVGLWAGVELQRSNGLYWTIASLSLAGLVQSVWLWFRARGPLLQFRDL